MTKQEELAMATDMWKDWILAERKVMAGQSYEIGSRRLRRADLKEIRDTIIYWKSEMDRLSGHSRTKVRQIIHRDV